MVHYSGKLGHRMKKLGCLNGQNHTYSSIWMRGGHDKVPLRHGASLQPSYQADDPQSSRRCVINMTSCDLGDNACRKSCDALLAHAALTQDCEKRKKKRISAKISSRDIWCYAYRDVKFPALHICASGLCAYSTLSIETGTILQSHDVAEEQVKVAADSGEWRALACVMYLLALLPSH